MATEQVLQVPIRRYTIEANGRSQTFWAASRRHQSA